MTAESDDNTYLDGENAGWSDTAQGIKSAGDTSFTLAWKAGDTGQQERVDWFTSGAVRGYKIKYANGDPIDIPHDTFISVRVQMPETEVQATVVETVPDEVTNEVVLDTSAQA